MATPIIERPSKYWFADNYKGSTIDPNVGVLHTTEGTSLPWYDGGAKAPHYTATPDFTRKRLVWTQHFPDTMSSRALRNEAGGVETNTLNCIQVELVGTCDATTSKNWKAAGRNHIYWADAPQWALDEVAEFVALKHKERGIRIEGPGQIGETWRAYPSSYGKSASQRFSFSQWTNFYGWCGHEHVPENDHGDPGALNWAYIETKAKTIVSGKPPVPAKDDDMALSPNDIVGTNADGSPMTLGQLSARVDFVYRAILEGGRIDARFDGIDAQLDRIEDDTDDGTVTPA